MCPTEVYIYFYRIGAGELLQRARSTSCRQASGGLYTAAFGVYASASARAAAKSAGIQWVLPAAALLIHARTSSLTTAAEENENERVGSSVGRREKGAEKKKKKIV